MTKAVWKVVLNGEQVHQLPFGAKPLHADWDTRERDKIAVWFEVDPDAQPVGHRIAIIGTGREIPPGGQYVGSVVTERFAWHVYCGASRQREG